MLLIALLELGCSAAEEGKGLEPTSDRQSTEEIKDPFQKVGRVRTKKLRESSGLVASFYRRDAFWTINDSGHSAVVYCLNQQGELLATVECQTGENRDWESLTRCTLDGEQYLVVADVGDNLARYPSCRLYFFPEPKFETGAEPPTIDVMPIGIELCYSDGARDCEAVAIDPQTNDIWFFEKMIQLNLRRRPQVYRIAADQWLPRLTEASVAQADSPKQAGNNSFTKALTAQRVGTMNHSFITGAEFSPNGVQLVIRTYTYAAHFQISAEQNWAAHFLELKPTLLALPIQKQGEAITFFPDNDSWLVSSEGVQQPLWLIDSRTSLAQAQK